jgi:hypothetical protein
MKKYFLSLLFFTFCAMSFAQNVEYNLIYNSSTGLYEARAQVTGNFANNTAPFNINIGSTFNIVVPNDDPSIPLTPAPGNSTNPVGATWVFSAQFFVNDPILNPNNERLIQYDIATGSWSNVVDGADLLLFTFDLGGCAPGVRLVNNATDTDLFGPGDFTNNIQALITGELYSGNVSNAPVACEFVQFQTGDFSDGANWEGGVAPSAGNTARILAGVTSTVSNPQAVGNLTTEATSIVTINSGQTLSISGDLTNNGTFEGNGYAVFNGTTAQSIIGDGTDAGSFTNIRLDNANGLTVTDDIDVTDLIDIDNGDITVETGDFITFKSTDTKSAVVANTNGGNINGCVVVERYIHPRRAFRLMSSPVTTGSGAGCNVKASINANLQEGEQVTDFTQYASATPVSALGTHITGSTTGQNGFDATQTGNPSMFLYDNAINDYVAIANTTTEELSAGQDFLLMVRGDRTLDLNVPGANIQTGVATTLRFTGELRNNAFGVNDLTNTPSPVPAPDPSPVYNAVGNPYQANVNLGTLLSANTGSGILGTRAYVYDPHGADDFGNWITLTYDALGNLVTSTPVNLGRGGTHNGILQANQAFFVENIQAVAPVTASVDFGESLKTNITTDGQQIFSTSPNNDLFVALDLFETTEDNVRDGVLVAMSDQYSDDYVQAEEAMKFFNYSESLAIDNQGSFLSVDKRNLSDGQTEVVQLSLFNYEATDYTFKAYINNPENKEVYFVDNYLGTQTLLDSFYYEYSFNVDPNTPASVDVNRFQLNFENTTFSNQDFELNGLDVYPNPVTDVVNVDLSQFTGVLNELKVFDITGKLVLTQGVKGSATEAGLDMSSMASGVYILKLETDQGQYQVKLIKE